MSQDAFYNLREVADHLQIKGLGRNNLSAFLKDRQVLMLNNIPYRQYLDLGYCDVYYKYTYYRNGGIRNQVPVPLFNDEGVEFIKTLLNKTNV